MAKSLRSKIKRRFKALKRVHYENVEGRAKSDELSKKQYMTINQVEHRVKECGNAFLKPNDENSVFPQFTPQKHIDFRSSAIPSSGSQHRGAMRKLNLNKTQVIQSNIQHLIHTEDIQQQQQHDDDDVKEFTEQDLQNVMNDMNILSKNQQKKSKKKKKQGQMEEEDLTVKKKIGKSKTAINKEKQKNSCKKSKKIFGWK